MQRFKTILIICLVLCGAFTTGQAQTVTFFYVAPTATVNANFPGAGQTTNMPAGYSFVQITAANSATFLTQATPRIRYVFTQLQPGTILRTQVNRVFNNSDRMVDVMYFLVDDHTGLPAGGGHMFLPYTDSGRTYVWPAANGRGPLASGRYVGWVMLGEHQLETDQARRTGGIRAIDEVVLHETSHTQWVGEWSKWGAVNGTAITYGADGMHYFKIGELLGDEAAAMNEGIGTFYGYTLNLAAMDSLFADFRSTGYRYFVESRSVMAGDAVLNAVASRRRDVLRNRNGVVRYPDGAEVAITLHLWRDIPQFYLRFAESTTTAFYSLYWRNAYSNRDTAFSFIGVSANSMYNGRFKRHLTYSCNRLALRMEEYNASAAGRADTSKTSSMLPFAILDLATNFNMADSVYRADYERYYPDRNPRAYTEYFNNHRNAIRLLVQGDLNASPIRFTEAMERIKNYCKQPATIF